MYLNTIQETRCIEYKYKKNFANGVVDKIFKIGINVGQSKVCRREDKMDGSAWC